MGSPGLSNCPHCVPQGTVRDTNAFWRQAPPLAITWAPQEEDTVSRSRTRRLPAWAYPQMSCEVVMAIGQ